MSAGNCIVISTLVLLTLTNLVLLLHVVMECGSGKSLATTLKKFVPKSPSNYYQHRHRFRASSPTHIQKRLDKMPMNLTLQGGRTFLAALILHHDDTAELACSVAAVSRNWVLVPRHCWESIRQYPKEFMEIVTSGESVHGIDVMLGINEWGALFSVFPFFKNKAMDSVALAGNSYKYYTNSTAMLMGWRRMKDDDYVLDQRLVKLVWYKVCEKHHKKSYKSGMVCITQECSFGHVFLVQNSLLVTMAVQSSLDCDRPGLFYKVATMQSELELMQKKNKMSFNVIFK